MSGIGIGTKLWVHNHRYMGRDRTFESDFRTIEVSGENRLNWIAGPAWDVLRISKKTLKPSNGGYYFLTEEEARQYYERDRWVGAHYWKIGDAVSRCHDYDTLRRVAELIGYKDGGGK